MKKIDSGIFNKTKKSNDEIILEFLEKIEKAVPPVAIVLGTGLSASKISQRLKQLVKYGKVRKFYRKLPLYTLREDSNAK